MSIQLLRDCWIGKLQHKGDAHIYFMAWQIRPIWSLHANRGFVRAFSVPCRGNELICLKDDKGQRRIEHIGIVFRRSTLS